MQIVLTKGTQLQTINLCQFLKLINFVTSDNKEENKLFKSL